MVGPMTAFFGAAHPGRAGSQNPMSRDLGVEPVSQGGGIVGLRPGAPARVANCKRINGAHCHRGQRRHRPVAGVAKNPPAVGRHDNRRLHDERRVAVGPLYDDIREDHTASRSRADRSRQSARTTRTRSVPATRRGPHPAGADRAGRRRRGREVAGIIHTWSSASISSHVASRTSPDRAAVSTRDSRPARQRTGAGSRRPTSSSAAARRRMPGSAPASADPQPPARKPPSRPTPERAARRLAFFGAQLSSTGSGHVRQATTSWPRSMSTAQPCPHDGHGARSRAEHGPSPRSRSVALHSVSSLSRVARGRRVPCTKHSCPLHATGDAACRATTASGRN